jgi:hypothetical protein
MKMTTPTSWRATAVYRSYTFPMSTKILLGLCILALVFFALRFVPSIGISPDVADFAGGFAVGTGIALAVVWASNRTPRA